VRRLRTALDVLERRALPLADPEHHGPPIDVDPVEPAREVWDRLAGVWAVGIDTEIAAMKCWAVAELEELREMAS
jgi:hypothetical protein